MYCITAHPSQGDTFNESYTIIYDWERLDKQLCNINVALTRACHSQAKQGDGAAEDGRRQNEVLLCTLKLTCLARVRTLGTKTY